MKPVVPEKPSRRRDLMNRVEPDNEFTQWRLWSRSCGIADVIAAAAAISVYAVAGIDDVVSWPSNQVLLSDPDLVRIAVVLLAPTLVWLIVSAGMVYGRMQSWRLSQLPARPRTCVVAAAVVCAAVIVGGFMVGSAKGAVRVLPGPRYQVSVIGNSPTGWTTVPLSQFRLWQASFVRADGPFMFWGLLVATVFIALLDLRRQATRARL
jgi:magnesium-transporting ATPase (P-type)